MSREVPTVTVVVLAFRDEPWLGAAVRSALDSRGVAVDVVVVDNGATGAAAGVVSELAARPGVRVVRPERNLGFAGGCNAGAEHAAGEYLALLNADARLAPDALARLVAVAADPEVGIATASVRLASDPDRINSAGNPLHYLGIAWAGGCGEPAARYADRRPVASASGAALVLRRDLWRQLGGFDPAYFAYLEDVELSWRCWQRGLRVDYVPDAVAVHRYEFARNPLKLYLTERNRLLFLLTADAGRTLLVLAPMLAAFELAMLLLATAQGWLGAKLRGYGWLLANRRHVRERRRRLQGERVRSDRELAAQLAARLEPAELARPPGLDALNVLLAAYWRMVRPLL